MDLAGYYDSVLWERAVLQTCENQPSIRTAAVAIGALDRTLEAAQLNKGRPSFELTTVDGYVTDHHRFALQQYGKAVRSMRDDIIGAQQNLTTTLISCLMLVCFELFHGNHSSALKQASIGLDFIIERLRESKELSAASGTSPRPLSDIDEALTQTFVRLDLQAMSFVDQSVLKATDMSRSETIDRYEEMPSVFTSLCEARRYWELSMRRIMNFMSVDTTPENPSEGPPGEIHTAAAFSIEDRAGPLQVKTMIAPFSKLDPDSDGSNHSQGSSLPSGRVERLEEWYAAFEPLFEYSRTVEGKGSFIKAAALKLRYKTTMIALSSSLMEGELQYDRFTDLFKDILELAEMMINAFDKSTDHRYNRASFTFDSGVIGSLYVVATKCRNRIMRRQAIDLLLTKPRREGIWDSRVAATFATAIMQMEEEAIVNGIISESARVRGEGITFDLIERKGILRYSRGRLNVIERRIHTMDLSW